MLETVISVYNILPAPFNTIAMASAGVVLVAKLITIWTPTTSDDKIVNAVLGVLNGLALNVLRDKNADAKD